jgi:hypothetical protein
MTELDQLLHSDKAWVRTRAELALQIVNQKQRGEITSDEAKELLLKFGNVREAIIEGQKGSI